MEIVDHVDDCTTSSCLRFSSSKVSIHNQFRSMIKADKWNGEAARSATIDETSIPSCDDLERVLMSDGRRGVVIFEEFSAFRSSVHSVWYWLDSCGLLGLEKSGVYMADMREFYNVDTETYVSDAETCSMRSDAVNFIANLRERGEKGHELEEVWFVFPYVSNAFHHVGRSTMDELLTSDRDTVSVLVWNQLHSMYCTHLAIEQQSNKMVTWHIGTLGDLVEKATSHGHKRESRVIRNDLLHSVVRKEMVWQAVSKYDGCLLYTSPSPRDGLLSRMPSSA